MVAAAVAGATVVGGVMSSRAQSKAAGKASDAQVQAAQLGVDEQHRQFDAIQKLLEPFVTGGTKGLGGQLDLAGLNGNGAQAAAIKALQGSPAFTSALQQGESSILANASATGGLRGGNVQGALAQFSPALLASTISDQYSRLGGLASLGQNSAAQTGNFGQASANNVTSLLGQIGSAQAGNALAQGQAQASMWGSLTSGLGAFAGLGGFGSLGGAGTVSGGGGLKFAGGF